MKKICLWALPMLLMSVLSVAQQFSVEKSKEFDEPDYGWSKLLQLKNGYTFFFHSTNKDGIQVVVYDQQRKQVAEKTLESQKWDVDRMKSTEIKGLYEINGEPVLFVMQSEDKEPTLFRMRLNPKTAAVIKDEELGHVEKLHGYMEYTMSKGQFRNAFPGPDIIVEKDPNSDNYAIVYCSTFQPLYYDKHMDPSKRIRVVHFDGNHKIINQAFYNSPGGKFKYMDYIGCTVDGDKRVYIATYGHENDKEDEAAKVIVSVMKVGDSSFKHKLLDFTEDFKNTKSVMLFNHNTNRVQLMTVTFVKSKGGFNGKSTRYYLPLMTYIQPETLEPLGVKVLACQKVVDYGKKNIDNGYEFRGVPQDMILNNDGTTSLLLEEVDVETANNSYEVFLQDAGISVLNDTGAETQGYAMSKNQFLTGDAPLMYISQRNKSVFKYNRPQSIARLSTDQLFSYSYIHSPGGQYVLFNDYPRNFDKSEGDSKRRTTNHVSFTNTIAFKLNGDKIDKFYLFGEPKDNDNSTFSYVQASDYNQQLNTYATLIVERNGHDKVAKVAWVKFN